MANEKASVTDLKQTFANRADNLNKLLAPPKSKSDPIDPKFVKSLNKFSSANQLLSEDLSSLKKSLDNLVVALTPKKSFKATVDQQSITNSYLKQILDAEKKRGPSSGKKSGGGIFGSIIGGVGDFITSLTPLKVLGIGGLIGLFLNGDIPNFGKGLTASISSGIRGLGHFIATGDIGELKKMLGDMRDSFSSAIPNKGILGWLVHGDVKGFMDGILGVAGVGGTFGKGLVTGDWSSFGNSLMDLPKQVSAIWGSLGDQAKFTVASSIALGVGKAIVPTIMSTIGKSLARNREVGLLTEIRDLLKTGAGGEGDSSTTAVGTDSGGDGDDDKKKKSKTKKPSARRQKKIDKHIASAQSSRASGDMAGYKKNMLKAKKLKMGSSKGISNALGSLKSLGLPVKGVGVVGTALSALNLVTSMPALMDPNVPVGEKGGLVGEFLGSSGGAWAGAAAGAAIGSVVPGAGTAVGGILGGILGGMGGSFGGQLLGQTIPGMFGGNGAPAAGTPAAGTPAASNNGNVTNSNDIISELSRTLKVREGMKLERYWDVDAYSVGYGHHITNDATRYVTLGGKKIDLNKTRLTPAMADELFRQDLIKNVEFAKKFPNWNLLTKDQQIAIADMTYNMGPGWLSWSSIPGLSKALLDKDWQTVNNTITSWKYHKDVTDRANANIAKLTENNYGNNTPSNSTIAQTESQKSNPEINLSDRTMEIFNSLFSKLETGNLSVNQTVAAAGVYD